MLTNDKKKEIVQALASRVDKMECPICHQGSFTLIDGYITDSVQNEFSNQVIGSKTTLPSVALVCNNCGFISQHSLGILGLLSSIENDCSSKCDNN